MSRRWATGKGAWTRRGDHGLAALAVLAVAGCAGTARLSEPSPFSTLLAAQLAWTESDRPLYRISASLPRRELAALGGGDGVVRLVLSGIIRSRSGKRLGDGAWPRQLPVTDLAGPGELRWCVDLATGPGAQDLELSVLVQGRPWGAPWHRRFTVPTPTPAALFLGEPILLARPAGGEPAADSPCQRLLLGGTYDASSAPVQVQGAIYDFAPAGAGEYELSWSVRALEAPTNVPAPAAVPETRKLSREGLVTPFALDLPMADLGEHELALQVRSGERTAAATQSFALTLHDLAGLGPGSGELALLRLLLSPGAADSLAASPPERRESLWQELWRRRDPDPSTPANEVREQALARVRQANLRFGVTAPGWNTDRGRVFIARGAPDRVDSMANPEGFDRIERWTYAASNTVYVFVDRDGRGEYTLQRTNAADD